MSRETQAVRGGDIAPDHRPGRWTGPKPRPVPAVGDEWATRIGLILAMAGNAVGLGNFLRFPTQAANNGGGAFMLTYFVALVLLGIRSSGSSGASGATAAAIEKGHLPGMFAAVWRHPAAKYVGVVGLVIPIRRGAHTDPPRAGGAGYPGAGGRGRGGH